MDGRHLSRLLIEAAKRRPHNVALEDERGEVMSYAELDRAADRLATRLVRWGVGRGDRVGILLPKSLEAAAAIHGVLRSGAAYVPVDSTAPLVRSAQILADGCVKSIVISADRACELRTIWPGPGPAPRFIVVTRGETELGPNDASWNEVLGDDAPSPLAPAFSANDLAYVLYTSGSTGKAKGVMLSHANAFTFLDWCDQTFDLSHTDRFASHAPFHFDLSVFDLFASCGQAATMVIISESLGKDPARLAAFLDDRQISIWYSAPSILGLLTQQKNLDRLALSAPRLVLFAGEVFPMSRLRELRVLWPKAQLWNLYGPTETNVCTAFPIPAVIPETQTGPFPIGRVCPPFQGRVVNEEGGEVAIGNVGELIIAGPGVMRGYFGKPELSAQVFLHDHKGVAWYRTGDLVIEDGEGCYQFHGRRDRMVKKRGYRIELGEIESALYHHDGVDRAAVIAKSDDTGVSIAAFVAMKPAYKGSVIAMKRHCTSYLPHYMVPDTITFLSDLPTTSTDKVDYQRLKQRNNSRETVS